MVKEYMRRGFGRMESTFPAAIANEPPPLDASSDEDSEELRSHGLKLDVPSGEPTPVSTPFKRPVAKSPEKKTSLSSPAVNVSDPEDAEEIVVEVSSLKEEAQSSDSPNSSEGEQCQPPAVHFNSDTSPPNGSLVNDPDDELIVTEESCHGNTTSVSDSAEDAAAVEQFHVPMCALKSKAVDDDCDTEICSRKASADDVEFCDPLVVTPEVNEHNDKDGNHGFPPNDLEEDSDSPSQFSTPQDDGIQEDGKASFAFEEETEFKDFELQVSPEKLESGGEPRPTFVLDVPDGSDSQLLDENVPNPTLDDDFEDDFGAFQSIPNTIASNETREPTEISSPSYGDEEDDFGDFAQVQPPTLHTVPVIQSVAHQSTTKDSEQFADFEDFSTPFQSCSVPAFAQAPAITNFSNISDKIDGILKSLFTTDPASSGSDIDNLRSIDSEIGSASDSTWSRVQDFESSHGLMFKWLNSLTEKNLLRSLHIDSSTIMYHEKWGTIEVPKFAASLVQSPLQPVSCNYPELPPKSDMHNYSVLNNNNNIADGLGNSCSENAFREQNLDNLFYKEMSLSREAQDILRQLPDLSYMRANTLVFPQASPSTPNDFR